MQLSNELLLVLGVAALVVNPLTDRFAAVIAGFFKRIDRGLARRRLRHAATRGAACPNGCG